MNVIRWEMQARLNTDWARIGICTGPGYFTPYRYESKADAVAALDKLHPELNPCDKQVVRSPGIFDG
jgi:hypothetical protein